MYSTILFLLIVIGMYAQEQCYTVDKSTNEQPLRSSIIDRLQNFESGNYVLVKSLSERYHCFDIPLKNQIDSNNYEVAVTMRDIKSYSNGEMIDFSIRVSKKPDRIQGVFITSNSTSWVHAQISYLVSSRNDIRVGSFIADTSQLLPCGQQTKSTTISHHISPKWTASLTHIYSITFINGLKSLDPKIQIRFGHQHFNYYQNRHTLSFTTSNTKHPLQLLYLSYLIFTMDSTFRVASIFDMNHIPTTIHVFIGVVEVLGQKNSSGLLRASNNQFFEEYFNIKGIIIRNDQDVGRLLLPTSPNTTNITCLSKSKCKSYGGRMQYFLNQQGLLFVPKCILCQANARYNSTTQSCQCTQGYSRVNQSCLLSKDLCPNKNQKYDQETKQCVCIEGWIKRQNICVQKDKLCNEGDIYFRGKCIRLIFHVKSKQKDQNCTTNEIKINGSCHQKIKCINNQILNENSNQCQCKAYQYLQNQICISCEQNQVWKDGKCVCAAGANLYMKKCIYCHVSAFWNGNMCVCGKGFQGNGIICRRSNLQFAYPGQILNQNDNNNNNNKQIQNTTINNSQSNQNKSNIQTNKKSTIFLGQIKF